MKHLVCISFYFLSKKIIFLKSVIENLLNYDVDLNIIIDTNSDQIFEFFHESSKIKIFVHKNLENPFFLTWKHREHFRRNLYKYDFFYYTEDDILLPFDNYKNYLEDFNKLWPKYIPSFVRIETKNNQHYHTDSYVSTKISKKNIFIVEKEVFVKIHNSYHGFWIMPRKQLAESINHKFCEPVKSEKTREISASFGLKILDLEICKSKNFSYMNQMLTSFDIQKQGLLKLDKNKISDKCYCFHLPNNYVFDEKYGLAKIKLNNIIHIDKFI